MCEGCVQKLASSVVVKLSQSILNFDFPLSSSQKTETTEQIRKVTETFFTYSLQLLSEIQRNLTVSNSVLKVLYQVCVFGSIGKQRWPPWFFGDWRRHSSAIAEWNLMKLKRKQVFDVFYQVCVFSAPVRKQRWPPCPMISLDMFTFPRQFLNII